MDVMVQHLENCPLGVLGNPYVYQRGRSTRIQCEIINRASEAVYAKAFATGRDQMARCVALDEVTLGELLPNERRQVQLSLTPDESDSIVGIYVGACRTFPICQGTVPRQTKVQDEGGDR